MNTSLRLLLEDYLGLMREEGELDVFLPLLLSAMKHSIVFRAQKGARQYGVDISTVGVDADGKRKLFLWLVKCGHIGRSDWDSGPQSIRQSINDVGDVYVMSHVAPEHKRLPVKLIVLTNGDFHSNLNQTMASFLDAWCRSTGIEVQTANGSTLAQWTEESLLNEYVLPPADRALLRRMLANVSSPELCISVGTDLIEHLVARCKAPAKSAGARRKSLLASLRGVRTSLGVLYLWAQNERNLRAPYRLAEFAVLAVWAALHEEIISGNAEVTAEFAELLVVLTTIAETYHDEFTPYYTTQNALASVLPDSLLVADAVFTELGRLGLQGLIWANLAVQGDDPLSSARADTYVQRVMALLTSHSASSPAYDHHAVDVHVALLLLATAGRTADVRGWLEGMSVRLAYVVVKRKQWPLTASFEDALAIQHGEEDPPEEFMSVTTLVPVLLIWCAALGAKDVYNFLLEKVVPNLGGTTMNVWSPDKGFDAVLADRAQLAAHGVGEGLAHVQADPAQFLAAMAAPLPVVEPIAKGAWHSYRLGYLPLLAAVYWRLQIPREMLVKQTVAILSAPPA